MPGAPLRQALQLRPQLCSERTITSFRELAQQVVSRRAATRHSMPFHLRGQKCILADKSFLSNYIGIQRAFFSISGILKWWKVWEDLFTNKNIEAPSVQAGVGNQWKDQMQEKRHVLAWNFSRRHKAILWVFFLSLERDPKSNSHILESKDPSSWQPSVYLSKGLLDSTGKLKICHRKKKKNQTNLTPQPNHFTCCEVKEIFYLSFWQGYFLCLLQSQTYWITSESS